MVDAAEAWARTWPLGSARVEKSGEWRGVRGAWLHCSDPGIYGEELGRVRLTSTFSTCLFGVEEKLKKVQSKSQEFKALYERKALELNKLRMQNVHLMNMSASSNGAKYEQNHVDRLYTLLQAEKAQ